MTKIVLFLIRVYQVFLGGERGIFAQIAGGGCRHYPTCSQYTYQEVAKHGVFKGLHLGLVRTLSCSPLLQ